MFGSFALNPHLPFQPTVPCYRANCAADAMNQIRAFSEGWPTAAGYGAVSDGPKGWEGSRKDRCFPQELSREQKLLEVKVPNGLKSIC